MLLPLISASSLHRSAVHSTGSRIAAVHRLNCTPTATPCLPLLVTYRTPYHSASCAVSGDSSGPSFAAGSFMLGGQEEGSDALLGEPGGSSLLDQSDEEVHNTGALTRLTFGTT